MTISTKKRSHALAFNMEEKTMLLSEACDKIAELIVQEQKTMMLPGYLIQFFIDSLDQGETPSMALALAKKEFGLTDG